jgi:Skp family chaperone for outer membrane proteins
MLKNLKQSIFPFIIAFSALSVSASAAFYSISGLSKLFAGASFEVIIMASSLEISKLVIASLLYQYWDTINKILRTYLMIATVILILITSMGIYGFLSAAYQQTASKAGNIDAQVSLVEVKRDNIKEQLTVYTLEKENINKAIADLRAGLANNIVQYKDKDGNIITSTSSATRNALERQLDQAITRQTDVNLKVDELNTQLFEYETQIVDIKTGSEIAGELGPLKYLSGLTGIAMDKIINVLLLVIIFVFDPLAISLVIAANFAFSRINPVEVPKVEPEQEEQYDPLDLNKDGIVDENEIQAAKQKIAEIENKLSTQSLSGWRQRKLG